jgi:hypothetical protein
METRENAGPALVGDFSTPNVFADEAILFDLVNGTVRITFATARNESPVAGSKPALVAIGRLVLPLGSAQRMVLGLHDYLVQSGLDPSASVRGAETAQ